MIDVISTFNKTDCVHYEVVDVQGCCGRRGRAGVCTITDPDGIKRHKTCSMKMSHCRYEKQEGVECLS